MKISVEETVMTHTGSTTDLINGEARRSAMLLWGHADYCLPMMLIINLIKLHFEREREREREEEV